MSSRNLFNRYIWLIDTIKRRGRVTRAQLDELWKMSPHSDKGEGLCRRTLYNYKNSIAELFDVEIECDPSTYEYYIRENGPHNATFTDWLLNSSAVHQALSSAHDVSDRILLEDVPSAREHLSAVLGALKSCTRIKFDYHNYTRSRPTPGVVLEPYMARIFKQRWYVIGRNVKDNRLKTYALDRMSRVTDTGIDFRMPEDFDAATYFKYSFGIVVNESAPRDIVLRTDHFNAKYLNALPLHPSQHMSVQDQYCYFYYRMQITDDLVQELLAHGSRIVVEQPRELRVRIREELRKNLAAYTDAPAVLSTGANRRSSGLPITDPEVLGEIAKKSKK